MSLLVNIIWLVVSGLPLALEHAVLGMLLCVTVVGIPFGLQQFKACQAGSDAFWSGSILKNAVSSGVEIMFSTLADTVFFMIYRKCPPRFR